MSKTLLEIVNFDDFVIVPEGTDPRDHAAEDVEAIAQVFANRTQYLRQSTDGAVQRDGDNILTGDNAFNGGSTFGTGITVNGDSTLTGNNTLTGDSTFNGAQTIRGALVLARRAVNEALLQTHHVATDAPNASGNRWDLTMEIKNAGGLYVRLLSGRNGDSFGAFAIAINARWDANTNQWSQENGGLDSTVAIWRYQDVRICRKPAGTAPWGSWQTTEDNEGVLLVETLKALTMTTTTLAATGNVSTTGGNVVAQNGTVDCKAITLTDEASYRVGKERSHIIPISDGVNVSHYRYANQTREAVAGAPNALAFWPIRLPVGSLFNSMWIHSWQAGGTPQRFRMYAQRPTDWGSDWTDIPDLDLIGEQLTTAGIGYEKTLVNCFAQVNVQADWEYFVEWRAATADAGGADAIIKLSCNYVDTRLTNQRTG